MATYTTVQDTISALPAALAGDKTSAMWRGMTATILFDVTGVAAGDAASVLVTVTNGVITAAGADLASPTTKITMAVADYLSLVSGQVGVGSGITKKMTLVGNEALARRVRLLLLKKPDFAALSAKVTKIQAARAAHKAELSVKASLKSLHAKKA